MKSRQRYLMCYDIPDDRRRTRLAKFLDGFGDRVQYSVFEAWLETEHFTQLEEGIRERMDEDEDTVAIYTLCGTCSAKVLRLGCAADGVAPGDEEVFIV